MAQMRHVERWDARPQWRGIANALVFSAALWALIAAVAWAL
jgi:hypothetical protein